jgi:hypothetical protein
MPTEPRNVRSEIKAITLARVESGEFVSAVQIPAGMAARWYTDRANDARETARTFRNAARRFQRRGEAILAQYPDVMARAFGQIATRYLVAARTVAV